MMSTDFFLAQKSEKEKEQTSVCTSKAPHVVRCGLDRDYKEMDENEDSIPFSVMFTLLQALIIEKLNLEEVATLNQCSRSSHLLCEAVAGKKFVIKADSVLIQERKIVLKKDAHADMVFKLDKSFKEWIHTKELIVKEKLTEEVCQMISDRMVAEELHCLMGISCSDTSFNNLIQRLPLKKISLTLHRTQTVFPYETACIKEVLIFNAKSLSKESFVNVKCKEKLTIFDLNCTASGIVERVKKMMEESTIIEGTIYAASPLSPTDLKLALRQLGTNYQPVEVRECFKTLYTHSWAIKSDSPLRDHLPFLVISLTNQGNISFAHYNSLIDKPTA